jgi:hypothetical protein
MSNKPYIIRGGILQPLFSFLDSYNKKIIGAFDDISNLLTALKDFQTITSFTRKSLGRTIIDDPVNFKE